MPELPEVEIARENLERWTSGRQLAQPRVLDPTKVEGPLAEAEGLRVVAWARRGKYLIGRFDNGWALLSHLGMTGKWVADPPDDRAHRRLELTFEDPRTPQTVALIDQRRFGQTWWLPAEGLADHARLAPLGPDALDPTLTADGLRQRLGKGRTPLKTRLLEQRRVAGLGNIAVVELCWRARVHPHTPIQDVAPESWEPLVAAARDHLLWLIDLERSDEIAYLGEPGARNPFHCYGRDAEPCPRCGTLITRAVLIGRPTYWCPRCQPCP